MNIVVPDPWSMNRLHPRHRRDRASSSLKGREGGPRPLQPREPVKPGNISMYDHVTQIKQKAEAQLAVDLVWTSLDGN